MNKGIRVTTVFWDQLLKDYNILIFRLIREGEFSVDMIIFVKDE